MKLIANIDGSSLGNPGEAGYGIVLKDENHQIIREMGRYLGKATNNVAEYHGLLGCLKLVEEYPVSSLVVYSDSELLVRQITGIYRVKQPHLQVIHAQILDKIRSGNYQFQIQHIPRIKNKEADRLARQAVNIKSEIDH